MKELMTVHFSYRCSVCGPIPHPMMRINSSKPISPITSASTKKDMNLLDAVVYSENPIMITRLINSSRKRT